MSARHPVEVLVVVLTVACGSTDQEQLGATAARLDVTMPAAELGIDDAVFRRVDSMPLVVCPPDTPFVCRSENAAGWSCSELACAPSCEKIGCPGGLTCIDCGSGAECAPADHTCN